MQELSSKFFNQHLDFFSFQYIIKIGRFTCSSTCRFEYKLSLCVLPIPTTTLPFPAENGRGKLFVPIATSTTSMSSGTDRS